MIRFVHDKKYQFSSVFNDVTGEYIRGTNCIGDPFMAEYPHLIDIGIMGSCIHGSTGLCRQAGVGCYQNGLNQKEDHMTLEEYQWLMEQSKGRIFEVALGGRGDPDMHPQFEEILRCTRASGIVPNFTTSGLGMTKEKAALCKELCGAVAVSWYSRLGRENGYTEKAVRILLEAGVTTNIHYVLSNSTIGEAVERLRKGLFPAGINAVIFLIHKPVGLGSQEDVLQVGDPRVKEFFELIARGTSGGPAKSGPEALRFPFHIGFDSCSVPGILRWCDSVDRDSIDTCEGGRFSMYIGPDMAAMPCSFDNQRQRFAVKLSRGAGNVEGGTDGNTMPVTIQDAWNSAAFGEFRSGLRSSCPGCETRELCMGGCPLKPAIVLCDRAERRNT